jgi:Na+/H+-dicarboxylate symporter
MSCGGCFGEVLHGPGHRQGLHVLPTPGPRQGHVEQSAVGEPSCSSAASDTTEADEKGVEKQLTAQDEKDGENQALTSKPIFLAIAILFGGATGYAFSQIGHSDSDVVADVVAVFALPGQMWLKALKCIVLPMIVFSMVDAMVMMRSLPGARTVGLSIILLYLFTTVLAALEGCAFSAAILVPNVHALEVEDDGEEPDIVKRTPFQTILGIFTNLIPGNLVGDAADGNLIPVILASIVFGLLVQDKEPDGTPSLVLKVISQLNDVVVKVVRGIMKVTPIGVGSLVLASAARLDLAVMGRNVVILMLASLGGLFCHLLVVYPLVLFLLGRRTQLTD